ncbi:hypothetical protein PV772_12890 [Pseudarthrobacter sp. CC12]|uniref:hypothetical protein n=1 Tax=unclassified Pseudarthrobacter TaxID=2647000 RepID=UPI00113FDDAE|nr:hypothetical protein [Pseudarthrobacter sp. NIBRBAC000502770]QDG90393.1 hypothetical protein NIBR502770_19245 [Pseudarthrobacter sp. NIBRBAC000502770]
MHKPGLLVALGMAAALLSACGPAGSACPAIAQATAVTVTVTAGYSSQVRTLHLRACQDGTCKESDAELRAGSSSVGQGCTEEGACSATASPDGTKVATLMLETLTESPMVVTASGTASNGTALAVRTLEFRPQALYPFGEQCGKFLSASLTLDGGGLHQQPVPQKPPG